MPDKKEPAWVTEYLANPPQQGAPLSENMQRKMNGTRPVRNKNAKAS